MLYEIAYVSEKSTEPRSGNDDRDKVEDTNMAEWRRSAAQITNRTITATEFYNHDFQIHHIPLRESCQSA